MSICKKGSSAKELKLGIFLDVIAREDTLQTFGHEKTYRSIDLSQRVRWNYLNFLFDTLAAQHYRIQMQLYALCWHGNELGCFRFIPWYTIQFPVEISGLWFSLTQYDEISFPKIYFREFPFPATLATVRNVRSLCEISTLHRTSWQPSCRGMKYCENRYGDLNAAWEKSPMI